MGNAMSEILATLIRRNTWASLRLLEACEELTDSQMDSDLNGTYGTVRNTIQHLVSAEHRYAQALRPSNEDGPNETKPFPGFSALSESLQRTGAVLAEVAESAEGDWEIEATYRGKEAVFKASTFLAQAIEHATEHRTQVRAIMTQQGVAPPNVDSWAYAAALAASA
ncbi:MAG: hypothetical protein GEU28_13825 [Dehalococcoidia bacterium]|nr:hypothetical protein [Dehalococcoidia bacterium]